MADKLNIYQKLIEVRKAVPYLKKENSGYQFKYVSSSQTLGALREEMDNQGILLVPKVTKIEVRDHATRKGDHEYFTCMDVEFVWINAENPEEKIVCPWYGQGLDDGEKGVGKALTYAEKFFLLKFFNIATDKDDPDSFQKKQDEGTNGKKGNPSGESDKTKSDPKKEDFQPQYDDASLANMKTEMAKWFEDTFSDNAAEEFAKMTNGALKNPLTIKSEANIVKAYSLFTALKEERRVANA